MQPDINREVGEIKTQVRFLTSDVSEIKADVKTILAFKWYMAGKMTVVGGAMALLGGLIAEIVKGK